MTLIKAVALGVAALAGYAAVVATVSGTASAATAYRYWGYYVAHGTNWQYSQRGPASEYPVDGEVQGWRFAVQADAGNGLLPRAAPDFAKLCASTPARAGELRVGVIVDFGLATDAPAHERPPAAAVPGCVYVHDGQTGADVLAAAAAVRIGTGSDAGLVCGIDGYPKTECAVAVVAHAPSPTPSPKTSRTPAPAPAPAPAPSVTPSVATAPAIPAPNTGPPATATVPARHDAAASSPDPTAASAATQAPASALSLAALRSSTRHGDGLQGTAVAGIALIVALGAGALWRTRGRGR